MTNGCGAGSCDFAAAAGSGASSASSRSNASTEFPHRDMNGARMSHSERATETQDVEIVPYSPGDKQAVINLAIAA